MRKPLGVLALSGGIAMQKWAEMGHGETKRRSKNTPHPPRLGLMSSD